MSANTTTVATIGNPPSGLKGVAPVIFQGNRDRADNFMNEFRRYKLLNRNNETINIPFYRVLTALSYIRGPLVGDWVNAQDQWLEGRIDRSKPHSVAETDEVLWSEFEANFKAAWRDTAKTQNAYDQLLKLTMQGNDIDTYTATFERLAAAAEWEPDAKGTIARYREGLRRNIHRKILERERWPSNMEEWKEAARKEVNRSKEIENAGLNRFFRNQTTRDNSQYQTQKQSNSTRNSGIVPMEVDATGMTLPFKKLTDEERAKYRAEGRCFRCRTQGHMARNCPKGSNRPKDANLREANATAPTTSLPSVNPPLPVITPTITTSTVTSPGPTLTIAQKIQALEGQMNEEERGAYLDARDMGEDFCSAGF